MRAVLQSAELKDFHHQLVLLSTLTPGLENAINFIWWFFNRPFITFQKDVNSTDGFCTYYTYVFKMYVDQAPFSLNNLILGVKRKLDVGRWVLGGGSPLTFSGLPVTACYNTLTPLVTIWAVSCTCTPDLSLFRFSNFPLLAVAPVHWFKWARI